LEISIIILLIIYIIIDKYRTKKKIENISKKIKDILYHDKTLYIKNYKEGSLSILENEIQKLVLKLSDTNKQLIEDRNLLKESLEDISHQIKTPLTSLNLITERLKDKNLTNQQRKELIKEQIKLLDKIEWLIKTLLKLAQLDAHSITFKKQEIKTEYLIQKIIEPFSIILDIKNIQFTYEYNVDTIMIDIDWNCEALSNIIKNCIEALDEGGKLKLSIQSNALYDEIIIEDNGKGIHKKDLPHLFERFYKGENSSNQSIGIGLALTKKIIENQNGVITVENAYPGAKFIIHYYKENI
jgi:signal transduction histidine kinase